jgi:ribosome biogenesis protein Nip4
MNNKLKNEIKKFTKPIINNDVVHLTLTYKQKRFLNGSWFNLDEQIMEQNLNHFLNLINSKVFGNGFKRYGKKLKVLSKNEFSINQRLHNHLILEKPKRYDYLIFSKIIIQSINKTDWMYLEYHMNHPTSKTEKIGWFNYIMKGNLNHSIDWNNSVL